VDNDYVYLESRVESAMDGMFAFHFVKSQWDLRIRLWMVVVLAASC
jgi:hypothetical protein